MEGMLRPGTVITSAGGSKYTVKGLLGAGGQGEVYEVESRGKRHALKWYYDFAATKQQKSTLEDLILKGAPSKSFLWPQDLIYNQEKKELGYIMPLRPKNFVKIIDMMKRKVEPSFSAVCRATYNLTRGYQALHALGLSYRDISFGNMFFDPANGDVLICDNDNVSPNTQRNTGISGTPRFIAPEIITGKESPSRNTDLYSLAVLLFYVFMMAHPLEGKKEADIKCLDISAMNLLYGTDPVFIFDPKNKSNRPVKGYQDNALIYWPLYPQSIRDLFIRSFTEGLSAPNKRVTENQWLDAIANLITGLMICPKCGSEVFFDENKVRLGVTHVCWSCGQSLQYPMSLVIGKHRVLMSKGAKLYSHGIREDYDMTTQVGEVVQNPVHPGLYGLENRSSDNWTYIRPDGQQIPVAVGKRASVAKGARIDFGQVTGVFE